MGVLRRDDGEEELEELLDDVLCIELNAERKRLDSCKALNGENMVPGRDVRLERMCEPSEWGNQGA